MKTIEERAAAITKDPQFHAAIVRAIGRAEARRARYWWACATGETGCARTSPDAMAAADRAADVWAPRVLRVVGLTVDPLP